MLKNKNYNKKKFQNAGEAGELLYLTNPKKIAEYNEKQIKKPDLYNTTATQDNLQPVNYNKQIIADNTKAAKQSFNNTLSGIPNNIGDNLPKETVTSYTPPTLDNKILNAIQRPFSTFSKAVNPNYTGKSSLDYILPTPENIYEYGKVVKDVLTNPETYKRVGKAGIRLVEPNSSLAATNTELLQTGLDALTVAPVAKPLYKINQGIVKGIAATIPSKNEIKSLHSLYKNYKKDDKHRPYIKNVLKDYTKNKVLGGVLHGAVPLLDIAIVNKKAKKIALAIAMQRSGSSRSLSDIKEGVKFALKTPLKDIISKGSVSGYNGSLFTKIPWKKSPLHAAFYGIEKSKAKKSMQPLDKYAAPYVGKKEGDLHETMNMSFFNKRDAVKEIKKNYFAYEESLRKKINEAVSNGELSLRNAEKARSELDKILYSPNKRLRKIAKINDKLFKGSDLWISNDFDNYGTKQNIAGHMAKLNSSGVTIRDVWKFEPDAYNSKWFDRNESVRYPNNNDIYDNSEYLQKISERGYKYAQPKLLNKVIKSPIIIQKEFKFKNRQ